MLADLHRGFSDEMLSLGAVRGEGGRVKHSRMEGHKDDLSYASLHSGTTRDEIYPFQLPLTIWKTDPNSTVINSGPWTC